MSSQYNEMMKRAKNLSPSERRELTEHGLLVGLSRSNCMRCGANVVYIESALRCEYCTTEFRYVFGAVLHDSPEKDRQFATRFASPKLEYKGLASGFGSTCLMYFLV